MKARWLRHLSSYRVNLVNKTRLGRYVDPETGQKNWHWGDIDIDKKVIRIRCDLAWINKIWTLIHELIHAENPDMEEEKVYKIGDDKFHRLSRRSLRELNETLVDALMRKKR